MIIDIKQHNLPPQQALMAEIFNLNHLSYVSTIDFLSQGVFSPSACIYVLKEKGFIIDTVYKPVIDSLGRVRKGIAHHRVMGGF